MGAESYRQPRWLVFGSAIFCLLALVLFLLSVTLDARTSYFRSLLIPVLVVSVVGLLLFHLVYWQDERKRRIRIDTETHAKEREFASVFEHALDAILILDDQSACRGSNPAACRLLGVKSGQLAGRYFGEFFPDQKDFARQWKTFLSSGYDRGQMRLIRPDKDSVFVEYTAAAKYIPGRHVLILCDTTRQKHAETSLQNAEERFRQMADHIQEVFWMMDADTKRLIFVNRAFETITGRPQSTLSHDALSYREIIHPEDRLRVLAKLADSVSSGEFNEEFRIARPDGTIRWIWSRAFPVRNADQTNGWLVGTALDVTSRKHAEAEISAHLAAAEVAKSEADALRRATLALTQNLAMDSILDTLLACVADVVPYSSACVLFVESNLQLLVAREFPRRSRSTGAIVLDSAQHPAIQKVLVEKRSVHVADTKNDPSWTKPRILADARCWMGIPLIASDEMLGLLSIAAISADAFSPEHFRMAKSLALPAAVGIQNARTLERAAIYACELEVQLKELHHARRALQETRAQSPRT